MAATKKQNIDGLTSVVEAVPESVEEPTVQVYIPLAEAEGDVKVDQTENVTINGKTTVIRRGEYVNVKVPVFIQLRNKYPKI